MLGLICPNCGNVNRPGALHCEKCGVLLVPSPTATRDISPAETTGLELGSVGTARFVEGVKLQLRVTGAAPIEIAVEDHIVLGRIVDGQEGKPDIDLSPIGGIEKGVSRMHARIARQGQSLSLIDMGSTNGTKLNGQLLSHNNPYPLHEGDEIMLGGLAMRIFFK